MTARVSSDGEVAIDPRRRTLPVVSFQSLTRKRRGLAGTRAARSGGRTPRRLAGGARRAASLTPGRLRVHSVGVAAVIVLLWAALFATALVRTDAVSTVRNSAGRSIVAGQRMHAAMSKADATAVANFLAGEQENAAQLQRYYDNLATASATLVTLIQQNTDPAAGGALRVLSEQLPIYNGLIERARANHRLGYAVGAAYLRQASDLAQDVIIPTADMVITLNAGRLDDAYATATSGANEMAVLAMAVLCVLVLAAAQLWLFRLTNRMVNFPLAVASGLVAVALAGSGLALLTEQSRLGNARDTAYAPMALLAQSRVLALRAHADENLSLVSRGDGARFDADFASAVNRLGFAIGQGPPPPDGTLTRVLALDVPDAATRTALRHEVEAWLAVHQTITAELRGTSGFAAAVATTLGTGETTFNQLDAQLDAAMTATQRHFEAKITRAAHPLDPLPVGLCLALFTAALLSLLGYQSRINEYR